MNIEPSHKGQLSFASFNLEDFEVPPKGDEHKDMQSRFSQKCDWLAMRIATMNADVVGLQEVASADALRQVFSRPELDGLYDLYFIADTWKGGYPIPIAVAAAAKKHIKFHDKKIHKEYPDGFHLHRDANRDHGGLEVKLSEFTRPIMQLVLSDTRHPNTPPINFFVVHLKSRVAVSQKGEKPPHPYIDKYPYTTGRAISSVIRVSDACALRIIVSESMEATKAPHVVMGDFNDTELSDTFAILSQDPKQGYYEQGSRKMVGRQRHAFERETVGTPGKVNHDLFLCSLLQSFSSYRYVDYSYFFEGEYCQIDNVLVSEHFIYNSNNRVWSFKRLESWNDHLNQREHLEKGEKSIYPDHGAVKVLFDYNPAAGGSPKKSHGG